MKEKSMIKQAFIITAGHTISRFLGLIYVFPFAWLVGLEGQALFSYAYVPYVIFIDLATLGVPLGVSKFISIYNAQNDYQTSFHIYKKASRFMFGIGVVMFLTMFLMSKPLALKILGGKTQLINHVDDVTLVIRIISFALIIVPSIALLRGFFQGFKKAYPSAFSQIIEQLVRVLFILLSSFIIVKVLKLDYTLAIFFSVASASLGALAAYIILKLQLSKFSVELKPLMSQSVTTHQKTTYALFKELFKYAIPIATFGLVTSLYSFIDTLTFNKGYIVRDIVNAEVIYGTYAFEINKLIMIPVSLGMGLGVSLMIYTSEAYTKKNFVTIQSQIYKAFQVCTFIITPIIILMMVFNQAFYSFFYQAQNSFGPMVLLSYAPVAILLCFNHLTNAVMQGMNKQRFLMISMITGVCLKYLYNEFFIIELGYNGAILATTIGLLSTIIINLMAIKSTVLLKHLYLVRRLLVIFLFNVSIGGLLYIMNFHLLNIEIDYFNRLNCFLFLFLNILIYFLLYISLSYVSGILDILTGKNYQLKDYFQGFKNKYVTKFFSMI